MKMMCVDSSYFRNLPNGLLAIDTYSSSFIPNINWCEKKNQWTPSPIAADKHLQYSDYHIELMNPKEDK